MKLKNIFIACDTANPDKVKRIIQRTKNKELKVGYKIGLQFFYSKKGRQFLSNLKNEIIFVDLKLMDIPNTMVSAVKSLKDLKINYLTVHISSGLDALRAVKKISGNIKIVGVTTLTSLNNKDLKLIGYNKTTDSLVMHQAKLAKKANLDGIVCSPLEVNLVRKVFKKEIITPGIQLNKRNIDQKRVMQPRKVNSDWLVIGRAITKGNIKKNIANLLKSLK